jgi:hypothetical protein
MTYKKSRSHMRHLNNEQKTIVADILYQKTINLQNHFTIF